jgi:hypothetical protein
MRQLAVTAASASMPNLSGGDKGCKKIWLEWAETPASDSTSDAARPRAASQERCVLNSCHESKSINPNVRRFRASENVCHEGGSMTIACANGIRLKWSRPFCIYIVPRPLRQFRAYCTTAAFRVDPCAVCSERPQKTSVATNSGAT